MAKRRMLSIPIIETDSFYGLSTPAQALYLHLNLNADDDGVVDKVRLVVKMMNINRKYYKELIDGGYILDLSDGIAVITHWLLHNQIKKDRYVPGEHRDLIETNLKIEGFRYTKASADIFGDVCAPQESIVKDSIEKGSTDKGSTAEHSRGEERKEKILSLFLTFIQALLRRMLINPNILSILLPFRRLKTISDFIL